MQRSRRERLTRWSTRPRTKARGRTGRKPPRSFDPPIANVRVGLIGPLYIKSATVLSYECEGSRGSGSGSIAPCVDSSSNSLPSAVRAAPPHVKGAGEEAGL
eukprot:94734-Hanusia_phi.AAC.4